jgi:Ran GTPase-activating protein (RanGAP) involved in mRNA processing and transport
LAEALEHNNTLTQLNLGYNQIGVEGAKALAAALEHNTSLTQLEQWNNQIGVEGARALAAALEHNTSLTQLNLWNNRISVEGAKALAAALEHNITLTQLNLEYNQIGDEGAKALAAALEHNITLTQLNLDDNEISADDKKQLERLIERNQRLLKELQATALEQLKAGRVLLRNALPADNNTISLANLPLEIREHIVEMLDNNRLMTNDQQRLVLNYVESKEDKECKLLIPIVSDKLTFFKVTKCDRIRKQLKQDGFGVAEQKLTQLTA